MIFFAYAILTVEDITTMKKNNKKDSQFNNKMAAMIMVVIGLVGVYTLARSVYYENNYLTQLATVQNCGLVNKNVTVSEVQTCITNGLNNSDSNRVQAQIFEIAGTAMITAAVISTVGVYQRRKS
jgi:hypothetical protein